MMFEGVRCLLCRPKEHIRMRKEISSTWEKQELDCEYEIVWKRLALWYTNSRERGERTFWNMLVAWDHEFGSRSTISRSNDTLVVGQEVGLWQECRIGRLLEVLCRQKVSGVITDHQQLKITSVQSEEKRANAVPPSNSLSIFILCRA